MPAIRSASKWPKDRLSVKDSPANFQGRPLILIISLLPALPALLGGRVLDIWLLLPLLPLLLFRILPLELTLRLPRLPPLFPPLRDVLHLDIEETMLASALRLAKSE